MGFYDSATQYVIARNEGIGKWVHVLPNGAHRSIGFDASKKAGEVVPIVAKMFSCKQIGILSDSFGPMTKAVYGDVVWMKPGYGLD